MRGGRPRFAARRGFLAATVVLLLCWCGPGAVDPGDVAFEVESTTEGEDARVVVSLERAALTTAETTLLRIEVQTAETAEVGFPEVSEGIGDFAVLSERSLPDRLLESGRVVLGRDYVLQPFLPGTFELSVPEITLGPSRKIAPEPVTVTVESVLEDPEAAELEDIAPPLDIPVPWWWWVLGGVAAALVAVAAVLWWRRRKRASQWTPPVPPHERALAALQDLVEEDLPGQGRFKAFYLRLSDIVRHYLEERFGLRAPEQTTEEFLSAMVSAPVIAHGHHKLLRSFLEQADMVKFAKFVPSVEQAGLAVDAATRFVRQTVPREPSADEITGGA